MKISADRGVRRQWPGLGAALAGALAAASLGACASTVSDAIPQPLGGLSAEAPARPAEPAAFPAVHDMPPARDGRILTEAEIKKAQEELAALRQRRSGRTPTPARERATP